MEEEDFPIRINETPTVQTRYLPLPRPLHYLNKKSRHDLYSFSTGKMMFLRREFRVCVRPTASAHCVSKKWFSSAPGVCCCAPHLEEVL